MSTELEKFDAWYNERHPDGGAHDVAMRAHMEDGWLARAALASPPAADAVEPVCVDDDCERYGCTGDCMQEQPTTRTPDTSPVMVTACCGRLECGGECGNEWDGMRPATRATDEEFCRLQDALYFWLPQVPDEEHPLHARVAQDSYLLFGMDEGNEEKSAYQQGFVTLAAASAPSPSTAPVRVAACGWKDCPHGAECVHAAPAAPVAEPLTEAEIYDKAKLSRLAQPHGFGTDKWQSPWREGADIKKYVIKFARLIEAGRESRTPTPGTPL